MKTNASSPAAAAFAATEFARFPVDAEHAPALRTVVVGRGDVAVEADLQLGVVRVFGHGRGEENVVPPDGWRR